MPVIGHALVGFATGLSTLSLSSHPNPVAGQPRASRDTWLLVMILLAYLPDIAAQVLHVAGVSQVSRITHSVGFALPAAAGSALVLASLRLSTVTTGFLLALVSIGLHITLDVLQGTDRAILWPLTRRRVTIGISPVPASIEGELGFISALLGVGAVVARARGWRVQLPRIGVVPGAGLVLILTLAVTTHLMRDRRERQLRVAKHLVETQHQYGAAIDLLGHAERWPSPARPGRVDYLRAQAYAGLGDRRRAEQHYLLSYDADPSYFWVVADLALFYASGPEPASVRRTAVAPYAARLWADFRRRRDTPSTLRSVDQHLARGPR